MVFHDLLGRGKVQFQSFRIKLSEARILIENDDKTLIGLAFTLQKLCLDKKTGYTFFELDRSRICFCFLCSKALQALSLKPRIMLKNGLGNILC